MDGWDRPGLARPWPILGDGRADSMCCAQTAAPGCLFKLCSYDSKRTRQVIRICSNKRFRKHVGSIENVRGIDPKSLPGGAPGHPKSCENRPRDRGGAPKATRRCSGSVLESPRAAPESSRGSPEDSGERPGKHKTVPGSEGGAPEDAKTSSERVPKPKKDGKFFADTRAEAKKCDFVKMYVLPRKNNGLQRSAGSGIVQK